MSFIDFINSNLGAYDNFFWGIGFVFVISIGLIFTLKLRGVQIFKLGEMFRLTFKGAGEGAHTKAVSSFEAFCVGLGARIGVGNIAGVATAIVTGGPGAVFWMWVFAVIGAASSFVESTLAQIYKEKKEDGNFYGGPAYYISKGLGNKTVGVIAAILLVLTIVFGFTSVQACNATAALCGAFDFQYNHIVFAVIITLVAAFILIKGQKGAAVFSSTVVPLIALAWIIFALTLVALNFNGVAHAFEMIFTYAFDPRALAGGALGTVILVGLRRGIFSNEAGLGTVASVAAIAHVKHPVKQGFIQSFSVLVDTFCICTLTAIVVLSYGDISSIMALGKSGSVLVEEVAVQTCGDVCKYLIAGFLFVFAFANLIGNYVMLEGNTRYIKDDKRVGMMTKVLILTVVFISATVTDVSLIDKVSDVVMATMSIVNVTALLLLSRQVLEAYRDYRRQKDAGVEEPVFSRSTLSDPSGVTEWSNAGGELGGL